MSSYRDGILGPIQAQTAEPGLLNCDHKRSFWLSWHDRRVALGTGGDVNTNQLLSWDAPNPLSIASLALDTAHEEMGVFDVFPLHSNTMTVHTPDTYLFDYLWMDSVDTYVTFQVQSCMNVKIALCEVKGETDHDVHEVVLGADSQSNQK